MFSYDLKCVALETNIYFMKISAKFEIIILILNKDFLLRKYFLIRLYGMNFFFTLCLIESVLILIFFVFYERKDKICKIC
jgi:hypothetical protein